jgi:predicted subunit of tRNA(5-methylaminomethyl-2-thiouridylate) methyltransferase
MSDMQENVELLTIRFGVTSHAVNAEAVAAILIY